MNSEKLTEKILENLTRRSALIAAMPDIDIKGLLPTNTVISEYTEAQAITDVLQLKLIPRKRVVKRWQQQLQERIQQNTGDSYLYLQSGDLLLDAKAMEKLMKMHTALEIRQDVQEEFSWMKPSGYTAGNQMVDVQKAPTRVSIQKYRNVIHEQKVGEVHEGFDMNAGELAQICCSRKITEKHIKWLIKKLNETQSDVLCIYPAVDSPLVIKKYVEDLKNSHGKLPGPQAMLFVFIVDGIRNKAKFVSDYKLGYHITLDLGSRFTLAYVDPHKQKVIYADSLGHSCPEDLLDIVSLYSEAVFNTNMQSKNYGLVLVHDPNSTDKYGVHGCSSRCSAFYPLQKCQRLDGIVVCIIAAIACLKQNLFHFLTRHQSTTSYKAVRHLQSPTSHSYYLRNVLLSWFGDESITIDFVIPEQFDCYQMFSTYHPQTISAIPPYCFLPLVYSVSGLVDVIYPKPEVKPLERFSKESIKSYTRISTTRKVMPSISPDVKGSVKVFPDKQPITDVFQLASIPDETTLRQWLAQLRYCKKDALKDTFAYLLAGDEKYDSEAVQNMLNLQKAVATKEDVKKEVRWMEECRHAKRPNVVDQPRKEALETFQRLVHYRVFNLEDFLRYEILEDNLPNSEVLAEICCDRWVTTRLIDWFLSQLNAAQQDVVAICLPPRSSSSLPDLSSAEPKSLAVVLSVGLAADCVCITDTPGCHTSFCYVDVSSKHMTYCDSLGWPPPKNMMTLMETSYEAVFGIPLPDYQMSYAHHPITNIIEKDHHCTSGCATYYPLQTCGSIAGVVSIIMAAIACLSPDFFRFITKVHQTPINEAVVHFLQRPSGSSMYLRLVLAIWCAKRQINIGNVIPADLASFAPPIFHGESPPGSRKFTAETIESYTRVESTSMWLPESSSACHGVLRNYNTEKLVTDVFNKYIIPDEPLLHQWQEAIEEYQKGSREETRVYYEVINEQYDTDCINRMLSLHQAKRIQRRVREEMEWFDRNPIVPVHVAKLPSQKFLNTFQDIIHNNKVNEPLEVYNIMSDTLADIVCDRQLHQSHVQWVINQLNEMQTTILCVQLIEPEGTDKDTPSQISEAKSKPAAVLFMISVVRSSKGVEIASSSEPGSHFSICSVSLESKQVTYGDSLGWPAPNGLMKTVEDTLKEIMGVYLNGLEVTFCHDPDLTPDDDVHMCSRHLCASYFPLQISSNIDGVVTLVLAAIACLRPSYFNFLTKSMKRTALFSSLHLQRPHDVYLRQVLASWFANKRINIRNVLPKDLDTVREYREYSQ